MGVLDKAFAGNKGIVKTNAALLGGTATIIFVTPGAYDETTDSVTETLREVPVNWLPVSGKVENATSFPPSAGGGMYEKVDVLGTIPMSDLDEIPEVDKDRIRVGSETYHIKSVVLSECGRRSIR